MNDREERQRKVADWCKAAFGEERATNLEQRGLRLLEETIEAAQAVGVDKVMAHLLIDFVYDRPKGALHQELGGIGVTLLALAEAAGLSADAEELREVERVLAKPLAEFKARNAAKDAAGFKAVGLKG